MELNIKYYLLVQLSHEDDTGKAWGLQVILPRPQAQADHSFKALKSKIRSGVEF